MGDRFKPGEKRVGTQRRKKHAGMNGIVGRVQERSDFFAERHFRFEYERQVFHRRLDGTLCPAELLRLEGVDIVGEFGGNDDVKDEFHLPTGELAPVRQVHVFGQCVAFPAAGVDNRLLAPYARRAVEVHKEVAPAPRGLFNHKMPVNANRLGKGQTRFRAVQVSPASLYKSDGGVHHHIGDGFQKKILVRHKVRIENGDVFAFRHFQAFFQGARLEVFPVGAVDELDVVALRLHFGDFAFGHFVAVVGRIIEDLDLVLILRVVDGADDVDETFHAVGFVKNGKLGRDLREFIHLVVAVEAEQILAIGETHPARILEKKIDAPVAVESVNDKSDPCDDVDDKEDIQ